MPRKTPTPSQSIKTVLVTEISQANRMLEERIITGTTLKNVVNDASKTISIDSEVIFDRIKADFKKWDEYNEEMLRSFFNTDTISTEYSNARIPLQMENIFNPTPLRVKIQRHDESIQMKIDKLESIKERLPLLNASASVNNSSLPILSETKSKNKVFIVHGHNEEVKQSLARVLEKVGLEPVILHEKANAGMTIIEKLEAHSDVNFAVVLLTPDDEGKSKKEGDVLKDRARQNVIAELGFFVGKLGRSKVCPLYMKGVEIPSDFNGVTYIQYDDSGVWKFQLGKELQNSGFDIDLNKMP